MAAMAYYYKLGAVVAAASLASLAGAQNPGTSTPEVHPQLPTWKCTSSGGCVQQSTSVVLDWNYRWIHDSSGNSCTTSSGVSTSLCPDEATCSSNCVVEGVDYAGAGVSVSGSALTMYQYVKSSTTGEYQNASPRLYLLGGDGDYEMLQLNGQELTFTVDLSTLPCGENGALYLSQMDKTGGRNQYQTGGANYGSGYCDAQCPVQTWKNGTLNTNGSGFCCNEMDIMESNSEAYAMTPHSCTSTACDSSGCGINPYSQGYHNYYGPGMTVDTSRPFTVVTQFHTSDGSKAGSLVNITRMFVQDGKVLASAASPSDSITSCSSGSAYGGLATMGSALESGMVLIFSIWNDNSQYMNWLDSGSNGPCSSSAGNPSTIISQNPTTHVVWSNIRWGDIGSTYSDDLSGGSSGSGTTTQMATTTQRSTTTTTQPVTTTQAPDATQSHWGQCGGIGYTGATACAAPYACSSMNPYYSQCL